MAFSLRAGTNWCHDFPKLARESGFHFNMHRRKVRVDWNRISSIDVDRVLTDRDFSTIDDNVNNVVDYCLESEYDVKILDPNFVKLFRLAQLAVEYLLYCKQYLDHSVVILKEELRSKIEENSALKNELESRERAVKELRDKLKERSKIIETKLSDSHGEIHKCPRCPKTFVSALFASAHVTRRHPEASLASTGSPIHEQYRAETEKLHSEIKSLKERLNSTERLVRNESEKFFASESVASDDNREAKFGEKNDSRDGRYREEVDRLKAALLDEIRNLKQGEINSRGKSNGDYHDNGGTEELIRRQEREIKLLRERLDAKAAEEREKEETRRERQSDIWRSRIDDLETRYRADIDKLYTQLRVTQRSADGMRIDYLTRISDLERREASVETTLIKAARLANYDDSASPRPISLVRSSESREERSKAEKVPIDEEEDEKSGDVGSDRSNGKNGRESSFSGKEILRELPRKISSTPKSARTVRRERKMAETISATKRGNEDKREKTEAILADIERRKSAFDVSSSDKFIEKEEISESRSDNEESQSWLESESPDDSTGSEEEENETRSRNGDREEEKIYDRETMARDRLEAFRGRLRELGIDPEWRGIPDATFSQLSEIVRHHRSINSRKYRKFEEIRRKIIHRLSRRLATKRKENGPDEPNEPTNLERLVTNVKSKVSKALNILDKNDGYSNNNRRISTSDKSLRREKAPAKKPLFGDRSRTGESKSMISASSVKKSLYPRGSLTSEDSYENRPVDLRNKIEQRRSIDERTTHDPPHHLSHSYESIKDFISDTRSRPAPKTRFNLADNVSVAEKLLRSGSCEKIISRSAKLNANEGAFAVAKRNGGLLDDFENSPSNNSAKGVLKTTFTAGGGSLASLTKKKVFFDLESPRKKTDGKNTSESDFEISSIGDERLRADRPREDSPGSDRVVLLKTSQSEKIARISQQIEKQLSLSRRKPAGAVEAMFLDKFALGTDEAETAVSVYPGLETRRFFGEPRRDPPTKDANLEMEIDELLKME